MCTFKLCVTEDKPCMISFLKKIRWSGLYIHTTQLNYQAYQAHNITLSLNYIPVLSPFYKCKAVR